jgi:hypothetical protein
MSFAAHPLKPRQRRPQPRQALSARSMSRHLHRFPLSSFRLQPPSLRETVSPVPRTPPEARFVDLDFAEPGFQRDAADAFGISPFRLI